MAPKTIGQKQANLKHHFITIKTEPKEDVLPLSFPKLTSKPPFSPQQPPQLHTGERYLTDQQGTLLPLSQKEVPDFLPLLINDVYANIRDKRIRFDRQFRIKHNTTIKQAMDSINPFWLFNKPCQYLYHHLPSMQDHDLLWTEKYRPKSAKGLFQGAEVLEWLESNKLGRHLQKQALYLLVGPSGTGKSAAVQTAAQQAGYAVFESSPNARRSGKDLLHQLGEMTSSHLVGFDNAERVNKKRKGTTIILKDSVVVKKKKKKVLAGHNDMMHYFQKVSIKEKQQVSIELNQQDNHEMDSGSSSKEEEEEVDCMDENLPSLQPPKQSLVLLEEVDLLFEEDKGFWSAVKELSEKSKRPIIMTCNDVSKIPLDILNIIEQTIYFKAPEKLHLTSYLELICLAEGFFIPVNDLSQLVHLYDCDTRKLIHTLQFWCKKGRQLVEEEEEAKKDEYYIYEGFYKEVTTLLLPEEKHVHSKKENKRIEEEDDSLELMYTKIKAACSIDTWVARENQLEQQFNTMDHYYPNDDVAQNISILKKE